MAALIAGIDKRAFAGSVYRLFERLMQAEPAGLGGRLLLATDAGEQLEAFVRAANIAGAATLLLGRDSTLARERVRSGVCDFLVTTLDEALRILKNELRQQQTAAVYLLGDPREAIEACVERGVQPDVLALLDGCHAEQAVFVERGALLVHSALSEAPATAPDERSEGLQMISWSAPTARALAALDALALDALVQGQQVERRRWLLRAPQYMGRELGRGAGAIHTVPMAFAEAEVMRHLVSHAVHNGRLPAEIHLD